MRKPGLVALTSWIVLLFASHAWAQQADLAFGLGTLLAPSSSGSLTAGNFSQTMGGGTYLAFSGDVLLKHHLGINGEVAWRASQTNYQATQQPFRPIFYDFNGIWAPDLNKHITAELLAGIGATTTRFYTPFFTFSSLGQVTNYTSTTNFMGDLGGGIRFYVHGGLFIRPEARVYLIHNNSQFSSGHAERVGVSIGYSFFRHTGPEY